MKINHRLSSAEKRQRRVRSTIYGTAERPRLSVFRSNKFTYLQVINDELGQTVASVSTQKEEKSVGSKLAAAKEAAERLVEQLHKAKIEKLVFDRGSYRYHGRVQAIAEAMREGGIQV